MSLKNFYQQRLDAPGPSGTHMCLFISADINPTGIGQMLCIGRLMMFFKDPMGIAPA